MYSSTENFGSGYAKIGDRIGSYERGDRDKGDIISDITTSFVVLMGIFFPSVTGTTVSVYRPLSALYYQTTDPITLTLTVTLLILTYPRFLPLKTNLSLFLHRHYIVHNRR